MTAVYLAGHDVVRYQVGVKVLQRELADHESVVARMAQDQRRGFRCCASVEP